MLIRDISHITLLAFEDDRGDLAGEVAGFRGALRPVVAFHRQLVLVFPADAPLGRDVFCGHAHVNGLERVMQGADHHVDQLGVAHARAPAGAQAGIGAAAHVFGAASYGDVSVAQQDGLAGRNDGLQARAAQPIHVEGRCALGATAVNSRHPRQVHVFRLSIDHMAEHHVADVLAIHLGPRQ